MSPEAQRIAIAEACGTDLWQNRPSYLTDLNAMHEAEKVLTDEQQDDYMNWLGNCYSEWPSIHATAAQRAEAFLRTIGKWSAARSATQTKENNP